MTLQKQKLSKRLLVGNAAALLQITFVAILGANPLAWSQNQSGQNQSGQNQSGKNLSDTAQSASLVDSNDIAIATISGSVDTGVSSSFRSLDDSDYEASLDFGAGLKVTYRKVHSLSISTNFSKNLHDDRVWNFVRDLPIGYTYKGWSLSDTLSANLSSSLTLPLTEASRVATLNAGVSVGSRLTWKAEEVGLSPLSVSYGISLRQNFHTYEENGVSGTPNNARSLTQSFGANYRFHKWSFGLSTLFVSNLSYQNKIKSQFLTEISAAYDIQDNIGASISVGNQGSTLAHDGTNTNFSVYNPEVSQLSLGLSYSF